MYEDVGYDSVDHPLRAMGNNDRSMRRALSMYEQIGYDSIDQKLEEIARREGVTLHSPDVDGYESLDAPQREATGRGRPILGEGITGDDMGYSIPSEDTYGGKMDHHQFHDCESVISESGKFPKTNEQSDSAKNYSDRNTEEVNDNLNLGKSDFNPKETNPYLDLVSTEVNPYLDLSPTEVDQYMGLSPKEVSQNMDESPKELNQYMDQSPKEVDRYMDLGLKEFNQNTTVDPKEVNQNIDTCPTEVNLNMNAVQKEVDC